MNKSLRKSIGIMCLLIFIWVYWMLFAALLNLDRLRDPNHLDEMQLIYLPVMGSLAFTVLMCVSKPKKTSVWLWSGLWPIAFVPLMLSLLDKCSRISDSSEGSVCSVKLIIQAGSSGVIFYCIWLMIGAFLYIINAVRHNKAYKNRLLKHIHDGHTGNNQSASGKGGGGDMVLAEDGP